MQHVYVCVYVLIHICNVCRCKGEADRDAKIAALERDIHTCTHTHTHTHTQMAHEQREAVEKAKLEVSEALRRTEIQLDEIKVR